MIRSCCPLTPTTTVWTAVSTVVSGPSSNVPSTCPAAPEEPDDLVRPLPRRHADPRGRPGRRGPPRLQGAAQRARGGRAVPARRPADGHVLRRRSRARHRHGRSGAAGPVHARPRQAARARRGSGHTDAGAGEPRRRPARPRPARVRRGRGVPVPLPRRRQRARADGDARADRGHAGRPGPDVGSTHPGAHGLRARLREPLRGRGADRVGVEWPGVGPAGGVRVRRHLAAGERVGRGHLLRLAPRLPPRRADVHLRAPARGRGERHRRHHGHQRPALDPAVASRRGRGGRRPHGGIQPRDASRRAVAADGRELGPPRPGGVELVVRDRQPARPGSSARLRRPGRRARLGALPGGRELGRQPRRRRGRARPVRAGARSGAVALVQLRRPAQRRDGAAPRPHGRAHGPPFRVRKLACRGASKGVKIDFFQSDKQDVIGRYHEILKDAADIRSW